MGASLEVAGGAHAGRSVELPVGGLLRVGRAGEAQFSFPNESGMSPFHFELEWDGRVCRLRDVSGRLGTTVKGQRVYNATLKDGDAVEAGGVQFVIRLPPAGAAATPPPSMTANTPAVGAAEPAIQGGPVKLAGVADHLAREPGTLFALLDAAREGRVPKLLREAGVEFESLYDGEKGREFDSFAPYLARLPPGDPFLPSLVAQGWGNSWGVYLSSEKPFKEVRRHFRRFLLVTLEDGREVYFRFYDPRVLRVYLPTCTVSELLEFFGPVGCFLVEDDKKALIRFSAGHEGCVSKSLYSP